MKKGTFATHRRDRSGGPIALCGTAKRSAPLLFAMKPTCRRCRFYLLAPKLGREGALARMATEDADRQRETA